MLQKIINFIKQYKWVIIIALCALLAIIILFVFGGNIAGLFTLIGITISGVIYNMKYKKSQTNIDRQLAIEEAEIQMIIKER